MSTKAIIGLIALIVVVGGGVWYFSSQQTGQPVDSMKTDGGNLDGMMTGTFSQLLALNSSMKCEVTVTTPNAPAEGTIYVSGGADSKLRADIVAKPTTMGGKEVTAHMIKSGGYIYSWTDAYPQGVKIKLDATQSAAANQGFDPNTPVTYSCTATTVDEAQFVVPSTVTFMDVSAGAGGTVPGTMPASVYPN